ncbi:lysozyme inhibitor LprI family protein [Brevibacillus fulvus]|uniref:Uncharacterized protein YecT (DUF1311 family) n=1 Tax=Brevibacillus fulvus TaxID=1125967 RepID=A0A939BNP0_9BACL|nr:lysozyme inhibitor LprI family protein [Brevibacillus fulvus]MBM7589380.1 uncharacterized protein YecT (DUF1311 family) [Brevibacillus fulvus]
MKPFLIAIASVLLMAGCSTDQPQPGAVAGNTGSGAAVAAAQSAKPGAKAGASAQETKEKAAYRKKLDGIEAELSAAHEKWQNGTQAEMNEAAGEIYKKWDQALNEIYRALNEQLPAAEMSKLRDEQRAWVQHRDEAAKGEAAAFQGGSLESFQYLTAQARLTKERCYELLDHYMK